MALGNWFNLQQFTLSLWVKPVAAQVPFADLHDNNHTSVGSWVVERANSPEPADWRGHAGADAEFFFKLTPNCW